MGAHTTTGKVKIGLALEPDCYELLKQLAPGRRSLGALLDELIRAEAARRADGTPKEDLALAQQIADSLAVAMHDARLNALVRDRQDRLQALSQRMVDVQERERRALSMDLHDTSGQNLTALKLGLGSLKRADGCPEAVQAKVDELLHLAETVAEDLHRLAFNLRPTSLDRYGLIPALEQLLSEFQKQTGLEVGFDVSDPDREQTRLPGAVETALYRIVQESLTNIARYAQAATVTVAVLRGDDQVQVIVEDDGRGFDRQEGLRSGRLGLLGMQERAEMLGGTLAIESSPGHGTSICATVPVRAVPAENGTAGKTPGAWSSSETIVSHDDSIAPDARLTEAAELARAKVLGDALIEITRSMARCSDVDGILHLVVARSAEALGRDNAHIAVHEGDQWELRYGYREGPARRRFSDTDAPVFGWVERTRQVLVVDDTRVGVLDEALRLAGTGVKCYASVPLAVGDRLLGVLSIVNYAVAVAFHPSEVEFLNRLATLVTLALENVQLHDLTEQRRTQAEESRRRLEASNDALRKANAQMEALLSALPDGLIVYDAGGQVQRMNERALELLGYREHTWRLPVGERVGTTVLAFHSDGTPCTRDEYVSLRALRGEVVRNEDQYIHLPERPEKDFWGIFNANPIRGSDGELVGAVVTITDTGSLHETQRQLEETYQELEVAHEELQAQAEELAAANAGLEQRVQERTAELVAANAQLSGTEEALRRQGQRLELLHEIDTAILAERSPAQIAHVTLTRVLELAGARRATVVLCDFAAGTGEILAAAGLAIPGYVAGVRVPLSFIPMIEQARQGSVVTVEGAALPDAWPGKAAPQVIGSQSLVPLRAGDEVIGLLTITRSESEPLPAAVVELLTQVADSLALALANARLQEKLAASTQRLHALSRRLVERHESERSYVADRLYNEAAQVIVALKMQAGMLGREPARDPASSEWLRELSDKMDRALVELHRLASDLRPAVLDRGGLAAAIQQYVGEFSARQGIDARCSAQELKGVRLPAEIETCVYRVLQEALANAAQHARATSAKVDLTRADGKLLLLVQDNGAGFDVQEALERGGLGLVGMRERADSVGGTLEIESTPGSGTSLILEIPL